MRQRIDVRRNWSTGDCLELHDVHVRQLPSSGMPASGHRLRHGMVAAQGQLHGCCEGCMVAGAAALQDVRHPIGICTGNSTRSAFWRLRAPHCSTEASREAATLLDNLILAAYNTATVRRFKSPSRSRQWANTSQWCVVMHCRTDLLGLTAGLLTHQRSSQGTSCWCTSARRSSRCPFCQMQRCGT